MQHSEIFGAVIEQALVQGAQVRFRAEGTSMYPTIRDGETITVAAVSPDRVVRGDILLCRHGRRWLAHRVVRVSGAGGERRFELRGDAKGSSDSPVGVRAIVGRVIDVNRNGRRVPLCGPAARVRRTARVTASRARALVVSAPTALVTVGRRLTPIAAFRRR